MSDKNEKYTPIEYIEAVKSVLGPITLDPFSCEYANDNFVNARYFFSKQVSAFETSWCMVNEGTVYMNPPYSDYQYAPAVEKFLEEFEKFGFEAITLTNNNTDTITTQKLMSEASAYCFPGKRINYHTTEGQKIGNRFGQLFCYFGDETFLFREVFKKFGQTMINPDKLKRF